MSFGLQRWSRRCTSCEASGRPICARREPVSRPASSPTEIELDCNSSMRAFWRKAAEDSTFAACCQFCCALVSSTSISLFARVLRQSNRLHGDGTVRRRSPAKQQLEFEELRVKRPVVDDCRCYV